MIAEDKDNEPKDEDLWQDVIAVTKGEKNSVSRTVDGEEVTVEAPNDGDGFDVYPCVTKDAEALTPDGWKSRSELETGDSVYAYDRMRDVIDVTPIRRFHDYSGADVIHVESQGFNYGFTCTPGHKVVRLSESNDWQDEVEKTQERLVAASQIARGEMTYREAKKAGYSNMQGFINRYGGLELRKALDRKKNCVPGLKRIDEVLSAHSQDRVLVSAVAADASTVDWSKPYVKYETDSVQRVLDMSYGERMAFLQASVMCDGCLLNNNQSVSHSFIQKNAEHKEAVRLAAFLTGHMVTESDKGNGCSTFCIKTRPHITNAGLEFENAGTADVWCPETDYGTWVMRQGRTVTITGNSAYANGWAVQRYEDLGGEWKTVDESLYMKLAEDLDTWFDSSKGGGTWVDITRTNDDGSHPECGENTDKQGAPKCVPKQKANQMTDSEKERLKNRKRRKNTDSQSPDMTSSDPSDQRKNEGYWRMATLLEDDGLGDWFDEEWVDITEPKEDGEYPACGATADDPEREKDPRKNYPKCVPKSKVDKLSDEEIEDLARKKQKAVDDAESDLESDDGDSDEPVRTDTDDALEDSYSYRATTYRTGTQKPNVMRESNLRRIVREELLREQSPQPFTYDRGCMAFESSRNRIRLEFDLVGSDDAYLNLRGDWASLYRAQGGDRFANELEQMRDGEFMGCTITGEASEGVGATTIDRVRFELENRTVFEVQGRDAERFYNDVLNAPLNLSDPAVVDSLNRGEYYPA
jgi:hypothetical protein